MRAVVHDRYGPPDVLRLADVEKPIPKEDEILVRIHATTVNRSDCGWRAPHPFFSRVFTGLLRPKRPILGSELAGVVEAVGSGRHRVRGRRRGLRRQVRGTRRVRLRSGERRARAQAGRDELRGGGGRLRRRDHRAHVPAEGGPAARPEHRRLRRLRLDRHGRSPAGEALRCPRHRGVQHEERRARALARRRRGRRLHPGGLHEERRDVRHRLRRRRQALVQALPAAH